MTKKKLSKNQATLLGRLRSARDWRDAQGRDARSAAALERMGLVESKNMPCAQQIDVHGNRIGEPSYYQLYRAKAV